MTPADQYAQKREEAVELIRQHAPTRLQDALIELLRPAIALSATRADDSQIPIGASKFGGAPDVPANFEWPLWNDKPLGFLAQINLEEVAAFDVEELLPKSGLLLFFVISNEDTIWGDPDQREGWRVFFWPESQLQRFEPPADSHEFEMHVQQVEATAKWTLPTKDLHLSVLKDLAEAWERNEIWQHLLGAPRPLQEAPEFRVEQSVRGIFHGSKEELQQSVEIRRGAKSWRLLVQLDTMHWFEDSCFDLGVIYFMIRCDDLAAHDFSRVEFNSQTT